MTAVYLDPTADLDTRIEALLALLTDEQKLRCLTGIPALTLPDGYRLPALTNDGVEGLHGSGHHPDATMFPQAIGLGSTWDVDLMEAVGQVVGHETRARDPRALRAFGPVQDVRSNPLAGRYEESYGEDPLHCGLMGTAYAFGLKGRHELYLRVMPQMKHFFGYNHEWRRSGTSSSMSCRAMHEYQLVPYRIPVEAGAALGAMTAYNLVNGVPAIIHPLVATLRDEWAPGSFFVLPDMWDMFHLSQTKGLPYDGWERPADLPYAEGPAAVAALLLHAGVSLLYDAHDEFTAEVSAAAPEAVRTGLHGVTMADVDRLVRDWLAYLIRGGVLDGDPNPYRDEVLPGSLAPELALTAAREQVVLLKHERRLLPLDPAAVGRLAVIGPLADENLRDFYSPLTPDRVTPLDGLRARLGAERVLHSPGTDTVAWRSVASGGYVTAPGGEGELTADAPEISARQAFQVYDWGYDQHFFRNVETGRYLSLADQGSRLAAAQAAMLDGFVWFPTVNFHYPQHADGTRSTYAINYISEDPPTTGRYVRAGGGARHALGVSGEPFQADEPAARFEEIVLADGPERAAAVAADADYAVVVVGSHPLINGREAQDRPGLELAPRQLALVRAVGAARPGRTTVVIVSGYPLAVKEIQDDPNVAAILYTSHAGQAAGTALADVLFGEYAPAGRLSATWLADESSLPKAPDGSVDPLEYDVLAAKLTYRYSEAEPVYPFGHGLTYADVEYGDLSVPATVAGPFAVELTLTNTGGVVSDEVVQVYLRSLESAYGEHVPRRQLVGFQRVKALRPGETRAVTVPVDPADAFVWDAVSQRRIVETGTYRVMVGASSEDIRLTAELAIQGETIGVLDLSAARNAWECYTISKGVSHWEVSPERTLARRGGYHSVVSRRPGDHIGFTRVDLDRVTGVELRVATTTAPWADAARSTVEVRVDGPDGELLGTVAFPPTGSRQTFQTARAELRTVGGVRNLFLVFGNGGVYLDTLQLRRDP